MMRTMHRSASLLLAFGSAMVLPASTSTAQPHGTWQTLETEGNAPPRFESGFVELGGRMYMIGGLGNAPAYVSIYDPETNLWSRGSEVPDPVHHFQAVAHDGKIYVAGAWIGGYPRQDGITHVLIYDPATDSWTRGPEVPSHRRRGAAGAVVHEGNLYLVAGNDGGHGPHATAVTWLDRLDLETGEWEELPEAPHRRDHFQAVVVGDKIYAAAGRTSDIEGYIDSTVALVDVFDIASETWTTLDEAPIPTERAGTPTAAVGKYVIVTGGEGFGKAWSETEALDTETGTWEFLGHLNTQRHGTQMFLYNGRLWIAGGSDGQGGGRQLVDVEVFQFDD